VTVTAIANPVWTSGWLALPNVSTVSGVVPITLVAGETLVSGTLSYSPASNLADVRVLNPTTVGSGQIGVLDTTLIPNGAYWVQLVATDTNGNTQTNLALVMVTGEYKPGRITATVTDLAVPAKGLAISIQRRYDSLERGTSADFGYGWSVGVNVDLAVDPMNDVTFTLGGRRRTFYFTPQPLFQQFAGLTTPAYTAEPGLPGTLQPNGAGCVLGSGALSFSWDVLMQYGLQWMCDWAAPYSPPGYIYTDAVGTQYAMGADGSLQSITDLSGNSLTVTAAGITSSPSGVSVPFVRDGQGRITQITDTLGRNYLYGYDANGNLATVTFPGIATPAKYQYDATHLVTAEIDRRGTRTPALTTPTAGCNRSPTRRATPRSTPTTRPRKPPP
jgi:YD repeat-containing protein